MSLSIERLKDSKTAQEVVYNLRGTGAYAYWTMGKDGKLHVWAKRERFPGARVSADPEKWGRITSILQKKFLFEYSKRLKQWHGIYSSLQGEWIIPPKPY